MNRKLTLTLDDRIIEKAKRYAKSNKTSLSKLVEYYFKFISSKTTENEKKTLPPITRELSKLAKSKIKKSDKKVLEDALIEKYL